jgi:hypothetical protein
MVLGEAHESQHIGFGVIHQIGKLWHLGTQLIGDGAPLRACGFGVVLDKGSADEGGHDAPFLPGRYGERVPHEVDATALPGGTQHPGHCHLDTFIASEMTSLTPRRPRLASLRKNCVQNVSASDGAMSMPRTSRRPSLLTATATMTATDTMRPFSRVFM